MVKTLIQHGAGRLCAACVSSSACIVDHPLSIGRGMLAAFGHGCNLLHMRCLAGIVRLAPAAVSTGGIAIGIMIVGAQGHTRHCCEFCQV